MDSEQLTCLLAGFLAAEFSAAPQTRASVDAACTTAYNQCLAQATSTPPTFNCPSMSALSGCTATVGEYAACLNDATKVEAQQLQRSRPARISTVADLTSSSGPVQMPPLPILPDVQHECPAAALGGTTTGYDGGVADGSPATDAGSGGVDAGWPACPVITGSAISQAPAATSIAPPTRAPATRSLSELRDVERSIARPGPPEGPIYCIQSNVDQATCPGQ